MSRTVQEARGDLEGRVHSAIDRVALPAMGLAGRKFEITIPRYGLSSLIYLVDVEGGASFALRVADSSKGLRDLKKRRRATAFWLRRGLPTPSILHAALSRRNGAGEGLYMLCEERIHGGNVVDHPDDPAVFAAMGRALAQIHSVTRRWHHGSLFEPRVGPYAYRFVKRNRERLETIRSAGSLDTELESLHERWLAQAEPVLRTVRTHNLIHRRCTESDVLYDGAGCAYVLEPQRSGFGLFATDLVRVELRICKEDPDRVRWFLDAYFGAAPPWHGEIYPRLAAAFRADLHLAHAARWARKKSRGEADADQKRRLELERFREITSA